MPLASTEIGTTTLHAARGPRGSINFSLAKWFGQRKEIEQEKPAFRRFFGLVMPWGLIKTARGLF